MEIAISDKRNFNVTISVIGYPSCGESIVLCFRDGTTVLYSCVIDCFKYRRHNETVETLRRLEVDKINLLCWSHPDHDHSFDLDTIIENFCDERTTFLVPLGLNGTDYDKVEYNKGDKKIVEQIRALNAINRLCHVTTNVRPNYRMEIEEINFCCYPDEIPVKIHALSPPSPAINYRIGQGQMLAKNELAISLCFNVAGHKFLMCSDLEDGSIQVLHRDSLLRPVLVKVPHHSSPTSISLFERMEIDSATTCACTTGYKSQGLPHPVVLERYKEKCKMVHFTGTDNGHKFGVVEYTFTPFSFRMIGKEVVTPSSDLNIKCMGNAYKL